MKDDNLVVCKWMALKIIKFQYLLLSSLLLLLCCISTACLTHTTDLEVEADEQGILVVDDPTSERPPRRVLLTFLGFHGHENCFDNIRNALHDGINREGPIQGIECIEASPQTFKGHGCCNVCQSLDACYMQSFNVHLGLGAITGQARAVASMLDNHGITDRDEIILLGHSQGGLIGIECWDQLREKYNIKGMVTMSTPLQGVSLISSLEDVDLIHQANLLTESEDCMCCSTYCFPYCIVPCFKKLGGCCCAGLTDMAPDSPLLRKHREEVYPKMNTQGVPFLAIQAQQFSAISAPSFRRRRDLLLSGSHTMYNDGLIATECQIPPGDHWPQLQVVTLWANHGVETIRGYPRVFSHPSAQEAINRFCHRFFSNPAKKGG